MHQRCWKAKAISSAQSPDQPKKGLPGNRRKELWFINQRGALLFTSRLGITLKVMTVVRATLRVMTASPFSGLAGGLRASLSHLGSPRDGARIFPISLIRVYSSSESAHTWAARGPLDEVPECQSCRVSSSTPVLSEPCPPDGSLKIPTSILDPWQANMSRYSSSPPESKTSG